MMKRAALALVVVSHVASAQPPAMTKEFQAGVDAFRLGQYDEARVHLEKARDLDPKLPGPYRFLAAVAQKQNRWDDCIDNGHKALALNPDSSEAAETRKLYEACRVAQGRAPYRQDLGDSAAISVTTNVPGATVKINGLTYGGTPVAPRPITAGELEISIEKAGWKPQQTTIVAPVGIVTDLIVDLEPDPNFKGINELDVKPAEIKIGYLVIPPNSGAITIDGTPTTMTGERIELAPGTHELELAQPGKDPWRRRVRISAGQKTTVTPDFVDTADRISAERTGYYIIGAGAAVLAGGFVAAMISRNAANEARDIARVERGRDPTRPLAETATLAPVRTRQDFQDARDRHARFAVISTATYAAGLVTVGVGAYFLYKGARQRKDAPAPFAIAPIEGGGMIAKELRW